MEGFKPWQELSKPCQDFIQKFSKSQTYKRGDFLYRAGDPPKGIYFIQEGLFGLVSISEKGNEHLLRLFKAGQYFGHRTLLAEEKYHANAIAIESSHVFFVENTKIFEMIDKYPDFSRFLLKNIAKELRLAEIRRVSISENDVSTRVSEALVVLNSLYPNHKWTRKEIADFCGSTTATVIKTLSKMKEKKT